MEFWNQKWTWIREDSNHYSFDNTDNELKIFGKEGSIWGTEEFRQRVFGSPGNLVENILLKDGNASSEQAISAEIKMFPSKYGSQAGVLLYADDHNYVKFVLEGNKKNGTMIVIAEQYNGEAAVRSKVDVIENDGNIFIPLTLEVIIRSDEETELRASYGSELLPPLTVHTIKNAKFGIMAHSFEEAVDEERRWAQFKNVTFN
jgi:regulation of enolase protein 1 (concanavalin A-like superfamily)